jgi:hypothetical protein
MKTPEILVPSYALFVRESDGALVVLAKSVKRPPLGHREPEPDEQDAYVRHLVSGGVE